MPIKTNYRAGKLIQKRKEKQAGQLSDVMGPKREKGRIVNPGPGRR